MSDNMPDNPKFVWSTQCTNWVVCWATQDFSIAASLDDSAFVWLPGDSNVDQQHLSGYQVTSNYDGCSVIQWQYH